MVYGNQGLKRNFKKLRKVELAGHLQRVQEQDTCRKLTYRWWW
jgi:hypothetical protein